MVINDRGPRAVPAWTELARSLRLLAVSSTILAGCGSVEPGGPAGVEVTAVRQALSTAVFINESHYDNAGTDAGEIIEIAGPAGTDLSGYQLVLYNGANTSFMSYSTTTLSGVLPDQDSGFGVLSFSYPVNGIQNGNPDGIALVGPDAIVTQFLSYGGTFTAVNGPASGMLSVDIGVAESGTTPLGSSLQLKGAGTSYEEFNWTPPSAASPGSVNVGQTFMVGGEVVDECGALASKIHEVQGSGAASPLEGSTVSIEGVVVGDFQGTSGLRGFFVQEEDVEADADASTSEGLFVFEGSLDVPVSLGDTVRVRGTVSEFNGVTELSGIASILVCPSSGGVTATALSLPVAAVSDFEALEGMLVSFAQPLFATETFTWARFGEVLLSAGDRLYQPTNVAEPGPAAQAVQADNDRASIQLDDGSSIQNPASPPYVGPDNTLRIGDTLTGFTGVLSFAFDTYEVHPTSSVSFARTNPRAVTPADPGGNLKIASFNVLNYFTTLDDGANDICGPSANLECRGADSAAEFTRQRDKILTALTSMNADVVGLIEIENNASAALQDLVGGLNVLLGSGTYAYLDTGTIGTDAIKVGFIYKPATVALVGDYAILDSVVDPTFIDTLNRPVLAQTFRELSSGQQLTVAINHLKSKGSACDGDPDTGDGQGNCNQTRRAASQAEVNWLAGDPTGSGGAEFLVIGDMNAYALEDPIDVFTSAGYHNLIAELIGPLAYSYVFDGQSGYLDHALASPALASKVVGVTEWHINADEPVALDYNQEFNPPFLYAANAFRSSDHDPVIVSLELAETFEVPTCNGLTATVYVDGNGLIVGGPLDGSVYNGLLRGGPRSNVIVGTSGNDLIRSGAGGDVVCALGGNDTVMGGAGKDVVFAGAGNDVVEGGAGQDELYGEVGSDVINGGAGDDLIQGGDDDDTLQGDAGADQLQGNAGNDLLLGNAGADELFGGSGSDALFGGAGQDQCDGGTDTDSGSSCEVSVAIP